MSSVVSAHRKRVLTLYRDLLRAAKDMPTPNRVGYVRATVRDKFKRAKGVPEGKEREDLVSFGETMLDQIQAQASHLSRVLSDPRHHGM
jgi:succinate dehydrogenase assembly factor 1